MILKSLTATVLSAVALTVVAQTASGGTIEQARHDRAVAAQQALWMAEHAPRLAPDTEELIARSELGQAIVPRRSDSVDGALAARSGASEVLRHSDSVDGAQAAAAAQSDGSAVSTATSSGREIEWPQIGIGFGLGLVLALGFYLALRFTRTRAFAH